MRDPAEGVGPDGTIVTGVDAANVAPPFTAVVDDAVQSLRAALGEALVGVWIYGSVATGQAVSPTSDVDLIALVRNGPVTAADICREVSRRLTRRHVDVARAVAVGPLGLEDLRARGRDGRADRAFLRHYAAPLCGPDLREELPAVAPSLDLVLGLGAGLAARVAAIEQPDASAATVRTTARLVLMGAATLLSLRDGTWSTDRATGAELINAEETALGPAAAVALAIANDLPAAPEPGEARAAIAEVGHWVLARRRATDA